jgi:tetratricopeptide (TPR) repeat protein
MGGVVMHRRFRLLFLFLGMLVFAIAFVSTEAQAGSPDGKGIEAYHNQKGLEYYHKGFNDLTPKKKDKEAEQNYQQAIAEFEKAIAASPDYVEAHRNLARVYYVKKDFQRAAEQYKKVTVLDPTDVDSYVNLSLAYIKLDRYDDAILELENAKAQTSDGSVIKKLDEYIQKIQENR